MLTSTRQDQTRFVLSILQVTQRYDARYISELGDEGPVVGFAGGGGEEGLEGRGDGALVEGHLGGEVLEGGVVVGDWFGVGGFGSGLGGGAFGGCGHGGGL